MRNVVCWSIHGLTAIALGAIAVGCASAPGTPVGVQADEPLGEPTPSITPSPRSACPEDADFLVSSISDGLPPDPLIEAHWSQFVGRARVVHEQAAEFNTADGLAPDLDMETYDPPVSPFEGLDDDIELSAEEMDAMWEAFQPNGDPFDITRRMVLEVVEVYKGSPDLRWIVSVRGGGVITDTSGGINQGKVFCSVPNGIDDLRLGDESIVFTSDSAWMAEGGPESLRYDVARCLADADGLVREHGLEAAACHTLISAYVIDGDAAWSRRGHVAFEVAAVETTVAEAVATLPATGRLPFLDDPKAGLSNWPIPTEAP